MEKLAKSAVGLAPMQRETVEIVSLLSIARRSGSAYQ